MVRCMNDAHGEVWREVHEGFYEVSSLGNVRRAKPGIATFIGRPLLPVAGPGGYEIVSLSGPSSRRAYVHHLIAEAFIGSRPIGAVINHIDGNKHNNAAVNLEYVSRQQNAIHALENLPRRKGPTKPKPERKGPQRGADHWTNRRPGRIAREMRMPHCKLSDEQVRIARHRVASGETQRSVAESMGVGVAQMSRIVNGTRRLGA